MQLPLEDAALSYSLPNLRDPDQPLMFDVSLYRRPYRFRFSYTASHENLALQQPDFIVLCYSIPDRESLSSLSKKWKYAIEKYFNHNEQLPVMVLGLKRDLRLEDEYCVMPQTGLAVSQEMRCDRYAECSAMTGELCREVLEDIARTAANTTTEAGGKSGGGCYVM